MTNFFVEQIERYWALMLITAVMLVGIYGVPPLTIFGGIAVTVYHYIKLMDPIDPMIREQYYQDVITLLGLTAIQALCILEITTFGFIAFVVWMACLCYIIKK